MLSPTGLYTPIKDVLNYFSKKSQTKDKLKKIIFSEIQDNLFLLRQVSEGANFIKVINNLSIANIETATSQDFKFKSITKNKVTKDIIGDKKSLKYLDWDCEKILLNIKKRIKELKYLVDIFDEERLHKFNFRVRLSNLKEKYYLLFRLLKARK